MKRKVVMLIVLALLLAPAVQAAFTGTIQYGIGTGAKPKTGTSQYLPSTNSGVTMCSVDSRWTSFSGISSTLSSSGNSDYYAGTTDILTKTMTKDITLDGQVITLTFDFTIENTTNATDGSENFVQKGTRTDGTSSGDHTDLALGRYPSGNGVYDFDKSDTLTFSFSNISASNGATVTGGCLKFINWSTRVGTTSTPANATIRVRYNNDLDKNLARNRKYMERAGLASTRIVDGATGTIHLTSNTAANGFNLQGLETSWNISYVPEPATLAMLGFGALMAFRRRRRG